MGNPYPVLDYDLSSQQPTDEDFVIPIWTGDDQAIQEMLKEISEKTDEQLLGIWKALRNYDPRNYKDRHGKIGMDTWADAIQMELSRRHLPIAY